MKEDRNALLRRGGRSAGSKDWSEHDVVALLDGYDLTQRTTRSRRYKPRDFWRRVKAAAISLGAEPSRTENAYENKFKRLRREYRLYKQGSLQDGRVEIQPFVGKLAAILDAAGGHAPGASAMSDDSEHTGKDAMTSEVGPSVRRETRNSRAQANMEERLAAAAAAAQEAADAAQEGSGSASPMADTPLPESSQAGAVGAQASDRETAEAEAEEEAGAQQEGLKVLKEVTRELLGAAERQRQWEREAWRKDREVLDEIRDQNERMLRLLCGFILDREDLVAPIVNAELGLQTQASRPPR